MGCAHSPKSRPHAWAQSEVLWAQWSVVLYLPLSSGNKAGHFPCPTWNTQGNLQRVCCYKLTSWLTWFKKILLFSNALYIFCHKWKTGHIWPCFFYLVYLLQFGYFLFHCFHFYMFRVEPSVTGDALFSCISWRICLVISISLRYCRVSKPDSVYSFVLYTFIVV